MTAHPLAKYRFDHGRKSQEKLGEELSVTGVTISRWETGARKIDKDLLPRVVGHTGIPARILRPDLAELLDEQPDGAEAAQ